MVINPIIYAEISTGLDTIEDLEDTIPTDDFEREPLPYEAGFLAGRAFLAYRRRGGERRSPLPDCYIGAHAAVRGYRLLTRDVPRCAACLAGYADQAHLQPRVSATLRAVPVRSVQDQGGEGFVGSGP